MTNYVEVKGDLFNTGMCVLCVEAVDYDRYEDKHMVQIHAETGENYRRTFNKNFKTEQEANAYRSEFIAKVCI